MNFHKMVWAEGILLTQQHFQYADKEKEAMRIRQQRYQQRFFYGVIKLVMDKTGFARNQYKLNEFDAFFPNGDSVSLKNIDCVYTFKETDSATQSLYVCLPLHHELRGLPGYTHSSKIPRGEIKFIEVTDNYDSERCTEIMVMQDTVTLLSERESKEGFTFLKIASLHKASGPYGVYYEMDAEFIPPIIHGEHHPFFLLLYRRILSAIAFKKDHLLERRRLFGGDLSIFCQHDPAHFLLLATLQEALSEGNYLVESPEVSPEQFYRVLRNLFSHLKNFSENFMECPAYQHQQLSETFLSLEKGILFLMENALPHNTLSITLKEQGQGRFQSEEIDDVLLTGHELYLAVFIQASDVGWISRVVEHIKIAAPSILDRLIFSALPGLPFSHVQKPPLRLPIKAGYEYFRLDKSHKYYEHIQAEKKIALFVSEEFNHAKLDIIGLQEEAS